MFWAALILIVFIGGMIFAAKCQDVFITVLWVATVLAVICLSASLYCGVGRCFPADEIYSSTETQLCADSTGAFFYRNSGRSLYYSYLIPSEDGGKEEKTVPGKGTKIYEDEVECPHITKIERRNSNPFVRFFFLTNVTEYEIHVPPSGGE